MTTPLPVNTELIAEAKRRILIVLLIINSGILVLSGGFGYLLAGRTLKPIQEMVEEQGRFISDASHELRTPLTALKTSFEVFLRDKKPTIQKAKVLVKDGLSDINLLQSLTDSLLQLAQYEKPNGHSTFTIVALDESISAAVQKVLPLARKKKIKIVENLIPVKTKGNQYALLDLWMILFDNAIKYSPNNKTITVSVEKKRDHLRVSILDQGMGIKEEDIPHIFDRFYRADKARSKEGQSGYGLGLSIAKKIVETHKGGISVESSTEKGTTFTIRLPKYS